MTGCGGVSCFCDSVCCACSCEACAPAAEDPAPTPADFASPVPVLPLAERAAARPNPCGGKRGRCTVMAPAGQARCAHCLASEKSANENQRRQAAAEAAAGKGRRR